MRTHLRFEIALSALAISAVACSNKAGIIDPAGGTGGTSQTPSGGSTSASGGVGAQAGSTSSGGVTSTAGRGDGGSGGSTATGGKSPSAGASSSSGGAVSTGGKSGSGAGTTSTGGQASAGAAGAMSSGGSSAGGASACGSVSEQLSVTTSVTPEGVKPGVRNWRIWTSSSLNIAPVYTAPLANCGTLVCYTTGTGQGDAGTRRARVARLDANDQLVTTHDLGAYECRGIAAEPDGHFAALLWAPGSATDCKDFTANGHIFVNRYDVAATASWSTELSNTSTSGLGPNCPTDFELGDSRLEFGASTYGAYYHVHSTSGHEGDTLKYVDLKGTESTTWSWGCSHSMSNVLRFNAADAKFMPACVTDCYPGTSGDDFATTAIGGVYLNNKNKVIDVDAGCNGSVAGELGGGAVAPSGWKIVFNAHQNAAKTGQSSYDKTTMNQDIGFAAVAANLTSGAVVWLTSTPSIQEADSAIERFNRACDTTEQYLVGWSEPGTAYKYKLGRVDAKGAFIEPAEDVSSRVKWGRRDDPFRAHTNGDVVWAWFDSAGSTTLNFARVRAGGSATCAGW
jgi:hypothetical protein